MNLIDLVVMGKRYRVTLRWLNKLSVGRVVDVFNEGTVTRYWIGWLFIKVMQNSLRGSGG